MDKNKIRDALKNNIGVFKNMEKDDLGYVYNTDGVPSHPYVDELIHRTEQALTELDTDDKQVKFGDEKIDPVCLACGRHCPDNCPLDLLPSNPKE